MTRPLVSILTPSLNQGQFLGDCLASVANQTYPHVEHVVCDGGSIDQSVELLEAAGDRVRWISEQDRSQSHALNKALALSRGDLIGWLNADDAYADRRAIERAVEAFSDSSVDVVYGDSLLVNESNRVLQYQKALPFRPKLYRLVHYLVQPTIFFRRTTLDAQPTFVREDLDFVMDRELLLRLAKHARFERIDVVMAIDRHQRARKVLSSAFEAERNIFRQNRRSWWSRLAGRAVTVGARLLGSPESLSLPTLLDPALPLVIPPSSTRLRYQVFTRRARMPIGRRA